MKRRNLIQKTFALALTVMVLFTVSVRETHYLFSDHHSIDEHCENHLHSADNHADCSVCKFDISLFTDAVFKPSIAGASFSIQTSVSFYSPVTLSDTFLSNSLRGPPALA
jgi:hypothetical protein